MTRAIILCGGLGERLKPITLEIPKAMIPLHGNPLLEQSIHMYWKNQVWETWLSLGASQANQIGEKYPYPPLFEYKPMGTGGWLKIISSDKGLQETFKEKDFYVNNADNLCNLNLKKMMEQHKRQKNLITIACTKVDDVREYGSVTVKNERVVKFKEKQQSPKPKKGYINTGFYIFSPELFEKETFDKLPMTKEKISLEHDIFPKIAKMNKIGAYVQEGVQWFDTGTMERYEKAIKEWKGV